MMDRQSHHRPCRYASARLPIVAAVAALGLTVWAQPADAGDNKAYPGSACVAWGTSTDIQAELYSEVVNNSTTDDNSVICPIVRDNTTNSTGTGTAWVYVYRDASATSSLSCFLYSAVGSSGALSDSDSAFTTGTGNIRLDLALGTSAAPGPYTIRCILPPLSKIYSYLVPEY